MTGYLDDLPPQALLESRVSHFLQADNNQSDTPGQTSPHTATPAQLNKAGDAGADILRQALELALGPSSQVPHLPEPRPVSSFSPELPALSLKMLQKIWADEYIDFAELPPAKAKPPNMPQYLEGRILLLQTQELEGNSRKAIPDFITWAQCFALYTAALVQKQPSQAADLMGYFFLMANNAKKFKWPSWLVYDQNFRQRMADTQDKAWAKTHSGLYASCFLHPQKVAEAWCKTRHGTDHVTSLCPLTPPSRGRTPQQQGAGNVNTGGKRNTICRDFNSKEKGCRWEANCFRRHVCSSCKGPHPLFKCRSKGDENPITQLENLNASSQRTSKHV